jgi:CHAT domain-containing protein
MDRGEAKRVWILLALLAGAACRGSGRDLERTFAAAQGAAQRGELAEAQALSDRGYSLAKSQDTVEWSWEFRLLTAEILILRGDFSGTHPLLSPQLPSGSQFDKLRARQRFLEARVQHGRGDLGAALETLADARRLAAGAPDIRLAVDWLDGQIRLRLGQWTEGETKLNAVVSKAEEVGDRHRLALALGDLGMGYLVRGRYDEALSWFQRVLSLNDLAQMTVYGLALNNAGICYARLGDFDRAIATQQRAVEFHTRRGQSQRLEEALGSLGNTYVLRDDHRAALPYIRRAFDVATGAMLAEDSARWAGNLATAYANLGNWSEAERFNEHARRLGAGRRTIKPVHFTLNAAEIAAGRGNLVEAQTLFEESLKHSEGAAAVQWSAQAGLARTAIAGGQASRASQHFEAALETIETTRSNLLKTEFKLSFLTQLIEFYQAYVDALLSQRHVERALEVAESSRGRVLAERHGVQTPQKVNAKALRTLSQQSGTVLLSYWLAPSRSSLWVVDVDGIQHVPLPPAKEIEDLVRQHLSMIHNSLANPLAETNTPGDRLYELLIAPISTHIKPGSPVVIVPDGVLHRLNFETLPVRGDRKHYWVEDAEIQIAPSLSMLTALHSASAPPGSLLVIGDAVAREPEFPALRYASTEIANVSKHFPSGSVSIHQKDRAAPSAYRTAELDRFAMIHFTAHAVANPQSPLDSAIMLSGPDHEFKLYARDVAEHPLNAELVTVSACRSAGERAYSGEGLVGFSWAFLRAGARRVIAGLWDVDDRSTADLMDQVYARIAAGAPPPQALREAKLAMLRSGGTFAKPYYWGPFQVFTVVLDRLEQVSVSSRKS